MGLVTSIDRREMFQNTSVAPKMASEFKTSGIQING
jgi:hypothetical protein